MSTTKELMATLIDHLKSAGLPTDRKPRQKVWIALAMAQEDGLTIIVKGSDGTYSAACLQHGKLFWIPVMASTRTKFEPGERVYQISSTAVHMVQETTSAIQ